jgi:uncharacterized protein
MAPVRKRQRIAAAAGFALWLIGAAAAVHVGFWVALGTTTVVLGVASLTIDRSLGRQLRRGRPRDAVMGLALGAAMAAIAWALYPLAVGALPWIARDTNGLYRSFAALTLAQAATALPLIVLGEELFWRGLFHDGLLGRLHPGAAVFLAAAAHALANLPTGSPVLMTTAFACGLCWSALRVATGGLLAPLVAHLGWNALVLFVFPISPIAPG